MASLVSGLPKTCTQEAFAELVGLSTRSVKDLLAKGVLSRDAKGKILVHRSLILYLEHLRQTAQGRRGEDGLDLASERAKLTIAQRELAELEIKRKRGEMLTREEVSQGWGRFASIVRLSVMALTTKIRFRLPHITAFDGQVIDELVREVLTDAAAELEGGAVVGADPASLRE